MSLVTAVGKSSVEFLSSSGRVSNDKWRVSVEKIDFWPSSPDCAHKHSERVTKMLAQNVNTPCLRLPDGDLI